ncbi:MAG: hypothetical protein ACI9LD_001603 [Polaromonas sp.]
MQSSRCGVLHENAVCTFALYLKQTPRKSRYPCRSHKRDLETNMPLPQQPTRPLTNTKSAQADKELLFKAIMCALIGLGVLISPYFIQSPGMQGIVAQSSLVGWFALALGIGFGIAYARRVMRARH